MASIRPVSRRFPNSAELWEETNLPLGVVLTPLAPLVLLNNSDNTPKTSNNCRPISMFPKCLHCGAPHPTKKSNFRPVHQSILLCYLCGKTSSTLLQDQQAARTLEVLDANEYDLVIDDASQAQADYGLNLVSNSIPTLPAMACPIVWWIVLDGTCLSRDYWTSIGSILTETLRNAPEYTHIGIVAATESTIQFFDMTAPLPHLLNGSFATIMPLLKMVPMDTLHAPNVQACLRALSDYSPSNTSNNNKKGGGMALLDVLETLMEYLQQATPVGNPQEESSIAATNGNESDNVGGLRYTGGKITCFLGNPPVDIVGDKLRMQPACNQGGIAGSCAPSDPWVGSDVPKVEPTDPQCLSSWMDPIKPELCSEVGSAFAEVAMGIDILCLTESNDQPIPFYGVPIFRWICERSGAPGPVLVCRNDTETLLQQVEARTPWKDGAAFGVQIRCRMPPGFSVDVTPPDGIDKKDSKGKPTFTLAPLYTSGGCNGPATAVPGEDNLWHMGTCDSKTSLTLDLQVADYVKDRFMVEGIGEVALKPMFQMVVAYTTIERNEEGHAFAVRKVRVSQISLKLSSSVELIYDAMDPEALATILFHKLCLSSLQDGLIQTQSISEAWLQSFLVCLYQSAEVEQTRIEDKMEQGVQQQDTQGGTDFTFFGNERLLDQEGTLSVEDVLLGQGHELAAMIPFLVYSLLQSDSIRPTCGSFRPSMDARSAAMAQVSAMTPAIVAKSMAPSLQMWSLVNDSPIMESIDLRLSAIQNALLDCGYDGTVFVLDAPQQQVICDSRNFLQSPSGQTDDHAQAKVGPRLEFVLDTSNALYFTPAPRKCFIEGSKWKVSDSLFDAFMLEDKATFSGLRDFDEWKAEIATRVHDELEKA